MIFGRDNQYSFASWLWAKSLIQVENHLHCFHRNTAKRIQVPVGHAEFATSRPCIISINTANILIFFSQSWHSFTFPFKLNSYLQ